MCPVGIWALVPSVWKAGDKSWVLYQEVAHLNALKQCCELMGVEDVSDLPPNYVSKDLESENEEIIFQANTCIVRKDKKESDSTDKDNEPHHSPPHLNAMIYSSLSPNKVRDCITYERHLNTHLNSVGAHPLNPPPKWDEFQAEQSAETLEMIIRVIRNTTRAPPAPMLRAPPIPKYIPRCPAPPPSHTRGRGGSGGRGGGQANRRGKRSNPTTRDPRRNHTAVNKTPIPTSPPITSSSNTTTGSAIIINSEPVEVTPKANDLAFFGKFTNAETLGTRAQIPTGHIVNTLRTQATCDSNVPSDQMLSTF